MSGLENIQHMMGFASVLSFLLKSWI